MVKNAGWLLSMVLAFTAAGKSEAGVVSVVLSGPSEILCGGSAEYTMTFTGTFNLANKFRVFWEVYDNDGFFNPDDLLDRGATIDIDGTAGTPAFLVHTFTLRCDDCIVKGLLGSSGEQTAEIYVIAEDVLVVGDNYESNELSVSCVPEPATAIIFVSGMLGLFIRKVRSSKPKLES